MTAFAFIKDLPCTDCDSRRLIRAEPPYECCARSRYGDCEPLDEMTGEGCAKLAAVEELSDLAVAISAAKFRHTPDEVREQSVRGLADVLFDWARDIGAEFDDEAFVRDCADVREGAAA